MSGQPSSSGNGTGPAGALQARDMLLATGVASFLGMFHFYKRKNTLAFKACYALMWPTLGGGIMLAVSPSEAEMEQRLDASRAVTRDDLRRQREANAATVAAMRGQFAGQQPLLQPGEQQVQSAGQRR